MFRKLFGSRKNRKNRRKNASTLRTDVQQLEVRILLKAAAAEAIHKPCELVAPAAPAPAVHPAGGGHGGKV